MNLADFGPKALLRNLTWQRDGRITASYVAPTANLRHAPESRRLGPYRHWSGLYALLPGLYDHQSIWRQVPVSAVMDKMRRCGDTPDWRQEMELTARYLGTLHTPPREKWTLLTFTLPIEQKQSKSIVRSLLAFTSAAAPPSDEERHVALKTAKALERSLKSLVPSLRPVTSGELRWFAAWQTSFGGIEPPYTAEHYQDDGVDGTVLVPLSGAHLNPPIERGLRHVAIEAPVIYDDGVDTTGLPIHQTTYRRIFVVSGFAGRWAYPDAAMADDLDDLPFPVRYAQLTRPVANQKARNDLNPLYKLVNWVGTESEEDSTPHPEAELAKEALDAELAALVSHKGPALPTLETIEIAGASPDELDENEKTLRGILDPTHTNLTVLPGRQTELWAALFPGAPRPKLCQTYERWLHAPDLAGHGIYHGDELGDDEGYLWALSGTPSHEDSPPRLVFRNPLRGPKSSEGNRGATRANIGDLGAGKSYDLKRSVKMVTKLGGGFFALDITNDGEWSRAFPEATVVRLGDSRVSLDPLRVFADNLPDDPEERAIAKGLAEDVTVGFLAMKLGLNDDPANPDYEGRDRFAVLKRAVLYVLRDDTNLDPCIPHVHRLLKHWASGNKRYPSRSMDRDIAGRLLLPMSNLADSDAAGASIMGSGRTLSLHEPAVIFAAPGLDPQTAQGKSTLYLASALGIASLFASNRFQLLALTEFSSLAENPWGARLYAKGLRQTRRAYGGMDTDSQLGRDYPEPELFTSRTAGRTEDHDNAVGALKFVGVAPTDDNVLRLQDAVTGEKVFRDQRGRVGWVYLLPALAEADHVAFRTDKGEDEDVNPTGDPLAEPIPA